MEWAPVLRFWFEECAAADHWRKDPRLDAQIASRFATLHRAAHRCELWHWRDSVAGRLAEIILLDQFSRNIYRDSPAAFASDGLALILAQEAVAAGLAAQLEPARRAFLYLPFMHSESARVHAAALPLFAEPGLENSYRFELRHQAIIDRFGRYPHRNAILGRESTAEELAFLQQPGSSF